jgi:hypothetical protein
MPVDEKIITDFEILALRKLHRDNAREVKRLARKLHLTAQRLHKIHVRIDKKAIRIAGKNYKDYHDVGFDEHGPMDEQTHPLGPGIVDIMDTARAMKKYAGRVAATPLTLPSE